MAKIKISEEQANSLINEMLRISDSDVDNKPLTTNPMDSIKQVAQKAAKNPDLNRAIDSGDVAMSAKTSDGYDVSAKKNTTNENIVSFKKMNEMKTMNVKKGSKLMSLNEFFMKVKDGNTKSE